MSAILEELRPKCLEGGAINFEEALALTRLPAARLPALAGLAEEAGRRQNGVRVDLCAITNARCGNCAEDCAFCAQSARHRGGPQPYPLRSATQILESARAAEKAGAHRFCIVTSGRELSRQDLDTVIEALDLIRRHTRLHRCASLGFLDRSRARILAQAGLERYNHNLETAAGFFARICTTHSQAERIATIRAIQEAGIEACSGGILNLGESPTQRIELAFELKALSPTSVPVNFLNPRPGTPLSHRPFMPSDEAIRYLSIFRLVMPRTILRLAGGRPVTFADSPQRALTTGVNGLLIGNYLTTSGATPGDDLELLTRLGLDGSPP